MFSQANLPVAQTLITKYSFFAIRHWATDKFACENVTKEVQCSLNFSKQFIPHYKVSHKYVLSQNIVPQNLTLTNLQSLKSLLWSPRKRKGIRLCLYPLTNNPKNGCKQDYKMFEHIFVAWIVTRNNLETNHLLKPIQHCITKLYQDLKSYCRLDPISPKLKLLILLTDWHRFSVNNENLVVHQTFS